MPKGKMTRRVLSIPNPLHHIKLCKVLDDEWSYLREQISSSQISLTIPSIRARSLRALSRKFSFKDISEKIITSSTSSRYLLRTDISRYYSTIYTHSIPWAIHSKPVAKAHKRDMTYIGNRIDNAIQSSQDGQTNGIPVGPDSSLISELLCSAIDKEVTNIQYKSAFRYIDDYFLFFDSLSDAEKAFSELHKIIRGYELELNPYKTKIIKLPELLEPQWVSSLDSPPRNARGLLSYISKIFEYSKMFPEDEVIKYGLSKIKDMRIGESQKDILVSFLLNVIMHEPSAIPLASEMLS
ncbi:RNA-directed DNA polymerase [Desulfosporosinus nitroreducens]|uniref:RNA-directed DNA polymerase n=1 Tax=Desulfosporosinus nitroreducens TaxID=2018668 RepID=A0ABT8QL80_9FIRM|nr:RNA-directed DNA polymerase [Desulfosporosinus nitroreducens]MDO0822088.1 RNA-directed DNA polymerase [Desulfosporosinus nitroreducens]